MKRTLSLLGFTAGALLLQVATAEAKPIPGSQHNPPLYVDESSTYVDALNNTDNYGIALYAEVANFGSDSNRARVDIRQGAKVIATAKCEATWRTGVKGAAKLKCENRDAKLKVKGALEADLVMLDDADDKEYLVRTYKLDVRAWEGAKNWEIAADDLIATAWARHNTQEGAYEYEKRPEFRFWGTGNWSFSDATLRCTVGGKSIADVQADIYGDDKLEADVIPKKGERQTWRWSWVVVSTKLIVESTKPKAGTNTDQYIWMGDNPGAWDCFLRANGRNLRELLFTVKADGTITSAPMQQAKGAPPLYPGIELIDIRIPKDAATDQRIKPDLLKKSMGWGMPWPQHDDVKAIHAALPAAVENANPKVPPKPVGKILPGSSHSPPRFVDEATTQLQLIGRGSSDGYYVHAYAQIANTGARGDSARLDWKSKGKVVAAIPCTLGARETTCSSDDLPALKVTGPIEADLMYVDDQDGNQYKLRTYNVAVAKFKTTSDPVYQIVPDDLLAAGWVRHNYPQTLFDSTAGRVDFAFWVARDKTTLDGKLRCTVNGTKIDDIDVSLGTPPPGGMDIRAEPVQKGNTTKYAWVQLFATANILWGERKDYNGSAEEQNRSRWLVDSPGNWQCFLRIDAKPVRQLDFIVTDKGKITSTLQQAAGAPQTLETISAIELRIPKDAKFDERVRPDAMKKSRGFGLAWPNSPASKAILGALPAASGLPDPK